MDNNSKIPKIDHGVDILGDEWEYEEEENTDSLRAEEDWEDLKKEIDNREENENI